MNEDVARGIMEAAAKKMAAESYNRGVLEACAAACASIELSGLPVMRTCDVITVLRACGDGMQLDEKGERILKM